MAKPLFWAQTKGWSIRTGQNWGTSFRGETETTALFYIHASTQQMCDEITYSAASS